MILRYSSMLIGSQNWNIPYNVYKILVDKYKITIEGFSSPINSQIMYFGKDKQFGSLFIDTDKIFGSIGNIFDQNLVGKCFTLNPPYVLDVMDKCADKAIETIDTAKKNNKPTFIFLTVANWIGAYYYEKLKKHKLSKHIILEKYKHYYENSNDDDNKIIAKFDSSIFILSYGYNYENYDDIIKAFIPIYHYSYTL